MFTDFIREYAWKNYVQVLLVRARSLTNWIFYNLDRSAVSGELHLLVHKLILSCGCLAPATIPLCI